MSLNLCQNPPEQVVCCCELPLAQSWWFLVAVFRLPCGRSRRRFKTEFDESLRLMPAIGLAADAEAETYECDGRCFFEDARSIATAARFTIVQIERPGSIAA